MNLQLLGACFPHDSRVAFRLRVIQNHRFVEQFETIDLVNRTCGRFDIVEDNECLTFRLQVGLGDDFEDVSIFREDLLQRFFELIDLDALLEISDLNDAAETAGQFMCTRVRSEVEVQLT